MKKQLERLKPAPDFTLTDTQGKQVVLSGFRGRQPVVLVLARGFR